MANKDKHPMPADGSGTRMTRPDDTGELASRRGGPEQGGESGGGAYPNPHDDKGESDGGEDSFTGHGGQSNQAYFGPGQLGEKDLGESGNAPSTED